MCERTANRDVSCVESTQPRAQALRLRLRTFDRAPTGALDSTPRRPQAPWRGCSSEPGVPVVYAGLDRNHVAQAPPACGETRLPLQTQPRGTTRPRTAQCRTPQAWFGSKSRVEPQRDGRPPQRARVPNGAATGRAQRTRGPGSARTPYPRSERDQEVRRTTVRT